MKIAICDDCREDALQIQAQLEGHSVTVYENGEQLLHAVEEEYRQYVLYLLDIYLDTMDGLELARRLRLLDEEAAICFVSSSDAFYREAYDLYAVQYLLKPVSQEDLKHLVAQVERWKQKETEGILRFKWRGKRGFIPTKKILFVSSKEHKLSIYCKDGSVQECIGKMDEIANQLCGGAFCRVHQSFVVNLYCVDSLDGNELDIAGYRIPISRRYAAEVKKRYQEILFEEMN